MKFFNLFFLMLPCFIFFSCKDNGTAEPGKSVEVTVKDEKGNAIAYTSVYLFKELAADATEKDPSTALLSGTTGSTGKISFSLEKLTNVGQTMYVAAIEKSLDKKYMILGSTSFSTTGNNEQTIQVNLSLTSGKLYYPFGYKTSSFNSDFAKSEYDRWKNTQVVSCSGAYRVIADPSSNTLVEAMGFGTLLSAYAKDKDTFDGLMRFYDSKRTTTAKNFMAWKVTCDEIIDPGSATDGDVDVAFANIVAYKQWNEETYLNKAKEIINLIKTYLITDCTVNGQNVKVLHPGYSGVAWGGCGMTDIMYYTPGFFRVFAQVTGDQIWNTLADDTYVLLNASANPTTGLIPDWQTAEGVPGPGGRKGWFSYDACRAPWRMSLDYLWNGNTKSKEWCNKISDWAYSKGAANIVDGYELDGTPKGTNKNSSFLGGFTVSMMTTSPTKVDNFANELKKLNDTYWFNLNTRVLYLFTLTGNFWEPQME
ncbi:putative Licheninase [uncultured Paludibacter sp.]|nr:putative Licheninase [uncultured Paludibacter sp.]